MARERKIIPVFGAAGMGKTALVKTWIEPYQAAHGPDSVIALDPSRALLDVLGELSEWPGRGPALKSWLAELTGHGEGPSNGGHRGMVILDDADRWLRPWIQEEVVDLWTANRHLALDIVITAHRPQSVPKEMLGSASELWLFAQEEPHAFEYFMKIRSVRAALESVDVEWPTEPGYALRVVPRTQSVTLVDVFNR